MNRNEQSKFHWNLNRNYAKREGVENTSGDIHKTKFGVFQTRVSKMKREEENQDECTIAHMDRWYVYSIWSLSSVSTSSIALRINFVL